MRVFRRPGRLVLAAGAGWLAGCGQPQQAHQAAGPATPPQPLAAPAATVAPAGDLVRDSVYFGRYQLSRDGEGVQALAYRTHPDSAWQELEFAVSPEVVFGLDTANVDRAGAPELLLTKSYKWSGNRGGSTVSTLYVLRVGQQLDTLFTVLVGCGNWQDGLTFYSAIERTQPVTAGYGFVRVGRVRTTCEQYHMPHPEPCRCNKEALRDADNPRFARPGRYRWQRGRLRWASAR